MVLIQTYLKLWFTISATSTQYCEVIKLSADIEIGFLF